MESIKIIKDFGVLALCIFGLIWLNDRLTIQEEKTESIENKLYDCFEERIKERHFTFPKSSSKTDIAYYFRPLAVLTEPIKVRRYATK